MNTRAIRVSSEKDYVAVDVIDEKNNIISTPFYLNKGESKTIKYKDTEENKWIKVEARINNEFTKIKFIDIDSNSDFIGMVWDSDFDELTDTNATKFI